MPPPPSPPDAPDDIGDYAYDTMPYWVPLYCMYFAGVILVVRMLRRWQRAKAARKRWKATILVMSASSRLLARAALRRQEKARSRWKVAALVVRATNRLLARRAAALKDLLSRRLPEIVMDELVAPKDVQTSRAALRQVVVSEPYLSCLMHEFALFGSPVVSESASGEWRLEMLKESSAGLGWLELSKALRPSTASPPKESEVRRSKDIFESVVGRHAQTAAAAEGTTARDRQDSSVPDAEDAVSVGSSLTFSQFLEALMSTAALCDPYARPPYSKSRFEKVLVDWLDTALVPHAMGQRPALGDVLRVLHDDEANADVADALDELRRVQEQLFDSLKEVQYDGRPLTPRGVSLARFVEMAERLMPDLPEENVGEYRQVAQAAFVRALPKTLLHRSANGPRLLRLATFREAALRLAFVHANGAVTPENLTKVELLQLPDQLGIGQLKALTALLARALPGAPHSAQMPVVPAFDRRESLSLKIVSPSRQASGTPRRPSSARGPQISARGQASARGQPPQSARGPRPSEARQVSL